MIAPRIMLGGRSDTGKSASLSNLRNPEKKLYLNFEGKPLPFAHNFVEKVATDPYTLHKISEGLITSGTDKFDTVIIDSITACMALFATKYINKECKDKMNAWGDYGNLYEKWAKMYLPNIPQQVIVLAHITDYEDASTLEHYTQAVVQGKLQKIGLEANFGVVVNTAIEKVETLNNFQNSLLNITPDEEIEKFKHVLQVHKTLETKDTKIRSPMKMWTRDETFIDSDVQLVLDRFNEYYKQPLI